VEPELARHSHDWMTWFKYTVNLAWLGFSDVHSGIAHYRVSVGKTYMEHDLNKVSFLPTFQGSTTLLYVKVSQEHVKQRKSNLDNID
jgi:hypothetical protein